MDPRKEKEKKPPTATTLLHFYLFALLAINPRVRKRGKPLSVALGEKKEGKADSQSSPICSVR